MIKNHYRVRMVLDNMPVTTLDLVAVRLSCRLLFSVRG